MFELRISLLRNSKAYHFNMQIATCELNIIFNECFTMVSWVENIGESSLINQIGSWIGFIKNIY